MTNKHVARNRLAVLATVMVGAGGALAPMAPSFADSLGSCTVTHASGSNLYTLTQNCTTDQTVQIPDGATFDGAGHTITGVDGPDSTAFNGQAIVGPTTPATKVLRVRNLNVTSRITTLPNSFQGLYGLQVPSGSAVRNVSVSHIYDAAGDFGAGLVVLPNQGSSSPTVPSSTISHVTVRGYQNFGIATVFSSLTADHLDVGPSVPAPSSATATQAASLLTEFGDTATVTQSSLANNNLPPTTQNSFFGRNAAYDVLGVTTVALDRVTIAGKSNDGDGVAVLPESLNGATGTDLTVNCSSITRTPSSIPSAQQTYGYGIDVLQTSGPARTGAPRLPFPFRGMRAVQAAAAAGTANVTLGGVQFANWRRNVHNAANVTRVKSACATGTAVLHAHSYRVDDEKPIQFFGRILPAKFGTAVHIQRATSHGWRTVKTVGERRSGRFVASVWMRDPRPGKGVDGPRYFRAVSTAGGKQVVSKPVKITLH